jgi:hypothetical protein
LEVERKYYTFLDAFKVKVLIFSELIHTLEKPGLYLTGKSELEVIFYLNEQIIGYKKMFLPFECDFQVFEGFSVFKAFSEL